jgi:hypothetical protein
MESMLVGRGLTDGLSNLLAVRYRLDGFGAGRSIWTVLVRHKAERSLLNAEACSPLDIDDGAGLACLAVQHVERARVTASKQSSGCVTLRIARALYEKRALRR